MRHPQRYRLTHEFELRDPAYYHHAKKLFEEAVALVHQRLESAPDYLAIEKCDEPHLKAI